MQAFQRGNLTRSREEREEASSAVAAHAAGTFAPSREINYQLVPKAEIAATGDYNLSGDRYAKQQTQTSKFPLVALGDKTLFEIQSGGTPASSESAYYGGKINWATLVDLPAENFITELEETERKITPSGLKNSAAKLLPKNTVLVSSRATIGRVAIAQKETATNQGFKNIIVKDEEKTLPMYIALMATTFKDKMEAMASGGTFKECSKTSFETLQIPLPPLEIQRDIVSRIATKQRAIAAARELIALMEKKIAAILAELWEESES